MDQHGRWHAAIAAVGTALSRRVQALWLRARRPDLVAFMEDLYHAGQRYDTIVLPPAADSAMALAWVQARLAMADRGSPIAWSLFAVPPGVHPDSRHWRQRATRLGAWSGYYERWDRDAAPMLGACIPQTHDRLFLSILYWMVIDDDDDTGTPLTDAAGGGVPHVAVFGAEPLPGLPV